MVDIRFGATTVEVCMPVFIEQIRATKNRVLKGSLFGLMVALTNSVSSALNQYESILKKVQEFGPFCQVELRRYERTIGSKYGGPQTDAPNDRRRSSGTFHRGGH
jgi:hypothetical protein